MNLKGKQAREFDLIPAPANSCGGCWFSGKFENNVPLCWALSADPLVKKVFKANGGSCKGVIAILSKKANIKKTA